MDANNQTAACAMGQQSTTSGSTQQQQQQPTVNDHHHQQSVVDDQIFCDSPGHRSVNWKLYRKAFWLDYLSLALSGILGIIIYLLRPAGTRYFPLQFQDQSVVYPEFAYPIRTNIIPIWLAAFLAVVVSMVGFAVVQIKVRSLRDMNAAFLGLMYALITSGLFQVFIKWLIGGLRPHFYAACKPDLKAAAVGSGIGFSGLMFDRSVCTGDDAEINDSLESFPSGHATTAFAGFVFLALYFNAHLKVFSAARSAHWKFLLFFAPLLGASLIAGSVTVDYFHHWYDSLGGAIIGTMVAFAAYRVHYTSIWDWRNNHLPLMTESPVKNIGNADSHDTMVNELGYLERIKS